MKPYVICHMISSLDGSIAAARWSEGPGNSRAERSTVYAKVHETLAGDAWLVGRVTMAEMTKGVPHPSSDAAPAERPTHFARRTAKGYAIALDPSGRLHFDSPQVDGDDVIVLLGSRVPDSHLRELAADGISYIVTEEPQLDLRATLEVLGHELGIRRLLLEGGGWANGAFLAAGLIDEISLVLAPALDGRTDGRRLFEGGEDGLAGCMELELTS